MTPSGGDEIRAWLESAASSRLLTKEETLEIARGAQSLPKGSPGRRRLVNKLVKHNMRLVVHLTQKFMAGGAHRPWGSPETADFLQIGCVGLLKAAEKYDPTLGYAFSTYAGHWIRSALRRYNLKTITPVHVPEAAAQQVMFYRRNGYFRTKAGSLRSEEWARQAQEEIDLAYGCVALDKPLPGDMTLADVIPDRERRLDPGAFHRAILQAMDQSGISEIGQQVLIKNLVDGWTIKQIGVELGLGIEEVKKEKAKALNQAKLGRELFRAATLQV